MHLNLDRPSMIYIVLALVHEVFVIQLREEVRDSNQVHGSPRQLSTPHLSMHKHARAPQVHVRLL